MPGPCVLSLQPNTSLHLDPGCQLEQSESHIPGRITSITSQVISMDGFLPMDALNICSTCSLYRRTAIMSHRLMSRKGCRGHGYRTPRQSYSYSSK